MFVDLLTVPRPRQGFLCAHAFGSSQEGGLRAGGGERDCPEGLAPWLSLAFPARWNSWSSGSLGVLSSGEAVDSDPFSPMWRAAYCAKMLGSSKCYLGSLAERWVEWAVCAEIHM